MASLHPYSHMVNTTLLSSIINLLFYLHVKHNVGPENINSNFFICYTYKMNFFIDGLPTPLTAIPVHTTLLHCMKGRCSIAISSAFPFRGQ